MKYAEAEERIPPRPRSRASFAQRIASIATPAEFGESSTDTLEENQLIIRGKQQDEAGHTYLHRGIAARQFQRAFVLAEGMQVSDARMDSGLLHIDLVRPTPEARKRRIDIRSGT